MPLLTERKASDQVEFYEELSLDEINMLVGDSNLRVLQTSSPVDLRTAQVLNKTLFTERSDVEFRIYGFYRTACDLTFLSEMTNLRHFAADLLNGKGIESLAALRNIESLSVGIFNLDNFDFLTNLPKENIRKLFLGATKSKRPSLTNLDQFQNLRVLYLQSQQKDIEVLSSLSTLEELTLRSISTKGVSYLNNLCNLWSLDIKLGGIRDFSNLEDMNQIKYLELWQIKGLSDIRFISKMRGLQFLFLQDLRNIVTIPDLSKLPALKRIFLDNMKGLKDITMLSSAPALKELIHVSAVGLQPKDFEGVLKKGILKQASVGFGSYKKNQVFRELAVRYGVAEYEPSAFSFA
jgi:hypothetical protein